MMQKPRIILGGAVGSTRRTLLGLLRNHAHVVGVLGLSPEAARNVSGYCRIDDLAKSSGIDYLNFSRINDPSVIDFVRERFPDFLFIVGLSQLVAPELLAIPTKGAIGFHPTKLPENRGRAPVAWLILEQKDGAATFFEMTEEADAGAIHVQEPFEVRGSDYASDVVVSAEEAIDRALDRWIPKLNAGENDVREQDPTRITFRGRRKPEDGLIEWTEAAEGIARLVRASSLPHPGAYSFYRMNTVRIWRADVETDSLVKGAVGRILDNSRGTLLVQTGAGLLRVVEYELEPALQEPTPATIPVGARLGYVVEQEIHDLKVQLAELQRRLDISPERK